MASKVKNDAITAQLTAGLDNDMSQRTQRGVHEGIGWVMGTNEIRAFADDSVAAGVDGAFGSRNRIADSRDGDNNSGQSGVT